MRALLPLFFLLPVIGFCQKGFGIGPVPRWVEVQEFATAVSDSADVAGYYHLLNDVQENAEENQTFVHGAIKVINDKGLSYASSWDWSYDPSYERMTFHELYILRGKQKIDHLSRKNFEIIQREENLSRASYDGSLSVIVNLKDVKTGDVVVYSYGTTGTNPVFKGHFFRTLRFDFGVPMNKISCRVIARRDRNLQFKDFGNVPERKVTEKGSMKVFSWEATNVPATNYEDLKPSWYSSSNRVQVTDFNDWKDFSNWTVGLFKTDRAKTKELTAFIDSLKSIDNTETKILTAIKTVQEKVRYLSFTDGMSAYRPHNPSSVFSNKYGDCKDKALLLSEILNEIGIESHPLLVSTSIGKVMDERLPAPWNFDHSIAQFKYNDSIYYIDATISSQRGSLKNIVTPDYYFGVVADEHQGGLTKIPETKKWSVIRAREDFEVLDIGGAARLKVKTYYTGSEADNVRDASKSRTKAETNKEYVDFYANEFPEIKIAKSISFSDDTVNNAITVYEEYDVPNFWKYDSAKGMYVADTYGRVISSYLVTPSTKARHAPFTIRYPLDIQLVTNIHVPDDWNMERSTKKVTGPGFDFNATWTYADRVIRLQFDLVNTTDIVQPSRTPEYLDKIDEIYNGLGFQISHSGTSETSAPGGTGDANGPVLLVILIASGLIYVGTRRLYYFNPRSRQNDERHNQIGGWLWLPAIGLTILPFRTIYSITSQWGNHQAIFAASAFSVHKVVLIGYLLSYLLLLGLSALCAILFWNRRTSAPYVVIAVYALNCLTIWTDLGLGVALYDMEMTFEHQRDLVLSIVGPAIWIPYFLNSERAKGTFTQRLVNWRDQQE